MRAFRRVLDEEMKQIYIYTLFESDGGRPRYTGVKAGDKVQIYELYRPGARKTIATIRQHKELIRDLIVTASNKGYQVITTDFKNHLAAFDIPLEIRPYNVYDMHLPDLAPTNDHNRDIDCVKQVLEKMSKSRVKEYQKLIANAAVVYHDLQKRGLTNNSVEVWPTWSLKVFSGRSKSLGFNVQGFSEPHKILPPGFDDRSLLIHFDWICADIRVASLLSGDKKLNESFIASDPYIYMMNIINADSEKKITREECKVLLLKSINSMDFGSVALTSIYTTLGEWIAGCSKITQQPGGYLETLLQRRFRVAHAKNQSQLAVLNGIQQGSVAHAMQNTIRKVWEKIGHKVVTEIHDSLVVASSPDPSDVKSTISLVAGIMLHPFAGLLGSNPAFPLKVSIGKRWKKWKLCAIYRESGVEYVQKGRAAETAEDSPEGEGAAAESSEEGGSEEGGIGGET